MQPVNGRLNVRVAAASAIAAVLIALIAAAGVWNNFWPKGSFDQDVLYFGVLLIAIIALSAVYLLVMPFPTLELNKLAAVPNATPRHVTLQRMAVFGFVWGVVFFLVPHVLWNAGLVGELTRLQMIIGVLPLIPAPLGAVWLFHLHWRLLRARRKGWLKPHPSQVSI